MFALRCTVTRDSTAPPTPQMHHLCLVYRGLESVPPVPNSFKRLVVLHVYGRRRHPRSLQ
jgi:hypothetical protein